MPGSATIRSRYSLLKVPALLASLVLAPSTCLADAADACLQAYRDTFRQYTITDVDNTSLFQLYDHHCESTGELKQQTFDSSAEFVIDAIPLKFTGDFSNTKDKFRNFCKTYRETRYNKNTVRVFTSTPIGEAMVNFNQCQIIAAATGVEITHKFAGLTGLVIDFHFKDSNHILKIGGVVAENFTCLDPTSKLAKGKLTPTSKLQMTSDFQIVCTRDGTPEKDGSTTYSVGSVLVAVSPKSYSVDVDADKLYSNHLASEATAKVATLEAALKELQAQNSALKELEARIKNMKVEVFALGYGAGLNPGGGPDTTRWFNGCTFDASKEAKAVCPNGITAETHVFSRSWSVCGDNRFAVACATY